MYQHAGQPERERQQRGGGQRRGGAGQRRQPAAEQPGAANGQRWPVQAAVSAC